MEGKARSGNRRRFATALVVTAASAAILPVAIAPTLAVATASSTATATQVQPHDTSANPTISCDPTAISARSGAALALSPAPAAASSTDLIPKGNGGNDNGQGNGGTPGDGNGGGNGGNDNGQGNGGTPGDGNGGGNGGNDNGQGNGGTPGDGNGGGNGGNDNGQGNGGTPGDGGGSGDDTTTTTSTLPSATTTTSTVSPGTTTIPTSTTTPAPGPKQPTATSLVVTPNPSMQGQPVTLSASVTSAGQSVAVGTVTFYVGSTGVGSAQVGADGNAVLSTTVLSVGSDVIDGVYSGHGTIESSTSATVTEVVDEAGGAGSSAATGGPGDIVLFGGLDSTGIALADTWVWDGTAWSLQHPAHSPPARYDAAFAYDPAYNDAVLFGGMDTNGAPLADTWVWDGSDWTQASPGSSPSARFGASASAAPTSASELSKAAAAAGVAGNGQAETRGGDVLLFGGLSATRTTFADTWVWTGTTWLQLSPDDSPPGRYWAAMAPLLNPQAPPQGDQTHSPEAAGSSVDEALAIQGVILFGGQDASGDALADTWVFNGENWEQKAPDHSPPARVQAALASLPDSVPSQSHLSTNDTKGHGTSGAERHGAVLMGGRDPSGASLGDVWLWNDEDWVELSGSPAPPARADTAASIDASLTSVITVGGATASGSSDANTWALKDATWSLVAREASVPSAPGGVAATANDHSATVSWTASASDGGSPITSYTVTASPGNETAMVTGCPTPTSATVTGLTDGTAYTFAVTASNASGPSQLSSASPAVTPTGPPAAPTNVAATVGDAQASLSWNSPNDNGSPVTAYSITVLPPCNGCNGLAVSGSPPATFATLEGLSNGTAYTFSVSATNALGTGPASAPTQPDTPVAVNGPPSAPQNLRVVSGVDQLSVSFDPPASNGGSAITSYEVVPTPVTVPPSPQMLRRPVSHGPSGKWKAPTSDSTKPHHHQTPRRPPASPPPLHQAGRERHAPSSDRSRRASTYVLTQTESSRYHNVQPHAAMGATVRGRSVEGVGGPAPATSIAQTPAGVAVAPLGSPNAGTAYLIDASSSVVRAIAPYGTEYVLAGTGQPATSGSPVSGLPATQAQFSQPAGVAVDNSGDVFIADSGFGSLSVVSPSDCASKCPFGLAQMVAGEVYVLAGPGLKTLYMPGSSTPAPDDFNGPQQIAVDPWGNVVVALAIGDEIRVVAAHSCTTSCPYGLATMVAGGMYVIAGDGKAGYSGDGAAATSAKLDFPTGVATDDHGDVFISDHANSVVRMVATSTCSTSCTFGLAATIAGDIYSLAGNGTSGYSGDGGYARAGEMQDPSGLGVDRSGNLYIADPGNYRVRLIAAKDCVSDCPAGLSSTTQGDIYSIAGTGQAGYAGDSGPATAAEVYGAAEVALDPSGGLLVSDSSNDRLRFVAGSGCSGSCPYGLALTVAGDIYTVAGTGKASYSGNGGPANMSRLAHGSLAVKSASGRAASKAGSVSRPRNTRKLRPHTAGTPWEIATIAGGSAPGSQLSFPWDVASDSAGNVIIDDTNNYRIEMVAANNCSANCAYGLSSTVAGYIYTIAGNGVSAFTGDSGPAIDAEIGYSRGQGVAVDSHNDILIADWGNDRVRLVAGFTCSSGCPYGLATMATGFIYTIAGGGNSCFPYGTNGTICGFIYNSQVNNIPALSAFLAAPDGIAVDSAGNYYITVDQTVTMMVAASNCSGNCPLGLSSTTANYMYLVAGTSTYCESLSPPCTFPPLQSGEPATASPFDGYGVAVDPQGDLVIAYGATTYLVANANCYSSCPYGLSSMNRGYLYTIAGTGYLAGGGYGPTQSAVPATSSWVSSAGLATDSAGDLLVAGGTTVDLVAYRSCSSGCAAGLSSTQVGYVYVVAGSLSSSGYGVSGYSGDGGPATAAELEAASGVAFDPHGNLLIADYYTNSIRKVFPPVIPSVTSLSPTSGPTTGGTQVAITGTGFTGASAVSFGTAAASSFAVQTDTEIAAIAPSAQTGVVDVKVSTLGGASPTSPSDKFTYVASAPVPTVTSVSPSSGSVAGGTQVVIDGTNLTGASAVDFGQIGAAAFQVDSSTQVTATTGPSPPGTVDVTVTTLGGQSAMNPSDLFDFVQAPPAVMAISPASGPYFGGTQVTIMGTMLSGASAVHFGPTPATSFQVLSETEVSATAPAGTGTVDVTVLTGGGFSAASPADRYSYIPVPTITGMINNMGSVDGGLTIDLHGSALSGTTAVMFGTVPAESFSVVSDTDLVVITPPGTGTVNVTVTTPSGTSLNPNAEFIYVASPMVTSVSPAVGTTAGGDVVYVNGTNFYSVSQVAFGTAVVTEGLSTISPNGFTIVTMSSTKLEVVTPPGAGTVDVTVTNLVATSPVSAADKFTYLAPATVTGVTPTFIPDTTGAQVTITGTNLATTSAVTLYSFSQQTWHATSISVVSDTEITAVLPAISGVLGELLVEVATAGGPNNTGYPIDYTQPVAPPPPGSTTTTTTVTNLTPQTPYNVCIVAVNAYGTSSPTCSAVAIQPQAASPTELTFYGSDESYIGTGSCPVAGTVNCIGNIQGSCPSCLSTPVGTEGVTATAYPAATVDGSGNNCSGPSGSWTDPAGLSAYVAATDAGGNIYTGYVDQDSSPLDPSTNQMVVTAFDPSTGVQKALCIPTIGASGSVSVTTTSGLRCTNRFGQPDGQLGGADTMGLAPTTDLNSANAVAFLSSAPWNCKISGYGVYPSFGKIYSSSQDVWKVDSSSEETDAQIAASGLGYGGFAVDSIM